MDPDDLLIVEVKELSKAMGLLSFALWEANLVLEFGWDGWLIEDFVRDQRLEECIS